MSSGKQDSSPIQSGIALISVLWVLILLSLLAASLSQVSRSTGMLAANLQQQTKAFYAAQAGGQWALWGIDVPEDQQPWLADGLVYEMSLDETLVQAAVTDENGKIDLNTADTNMLRQLMIAADVDDARAAALADAILDWRDPDQLKRLNGAEDDDYLAAGLDWEAKDASFESVLELRQVLGMDDPLFEYLQGNLTIHSGKKQVNPLTAPKLVLMALSDMDEGQADLYIEERRRRYQENDTVQAPILNSAFFSTTLRGLNYTVHTHAVINPRIRYGASSIVRRQGRQGKATFRLLETQPLQTGIFRNTEHWNSKGVTP